MFRHERALVDAFFLSVWTAELEEKFAVLDSGKFGCNSCGYVYDQDKGDPSYPIPAGELRVLHSHIRKHVKHLQGRSKWVAAATFVRKERKPE